MKNPVFAHLVIALAFLAASAGAYVFAYFHIEDIGVRIVEIEQEVLTKNAELANIREAQQALAALAESEARIKGYFVPADEVVPFLEGISTAGDPFGADVTVLSVDEDAAKSGRGMLTLSVQANGSFDAVMRTLGSLEYAPYDIALTDLTLDAGGESGAAWRASATFDIGTRTP